MYHIDHIGGFSLAGTCSTLMNFIFDGLPGVFGAGGTYTLYEGRRDHPGCTECDPPEACPIFSPTFIQYMREVGPCRHWYPSIAKQAKAKILYTHEGSWRLYKRYGHPNVGILYHRNIRAWATSDNIWWNQDKRLEDSPTRITDLGSFRRTIQRWVQWHERTLETFKTQGVPFTTFDTDRFVDAQEEHLNALCSFLGIPFDPRALKWWQLQHHKLGGRYSSPSGRGRKSRLGNRIARDTRWRDFYPEGGDSIVLGSPDVQRVLRALRSHNRVQ